MGDTEDDEVTNEERVQFQMQLLKPKFSRAEWEQLHGVVEQSLNDMIKWCQGIDGDELKRVLSKHDTWIRIAAIASAGDLEHILDSQLNVMVIFEHEFRRRFPEQHKDWTEKHGE